VVIALIVILLLWAMLRPRDRTVVSENYSAAPTRPVGTTTTTERVVSPRAAGGTETTTRTSETDTRL
jgi:hypothetical protein